MTKEQMDKVKSEGGFDSSRIEGIRTTQWDLAGKGKEDLVTSFGNAGVEKMIILEYHGVVVGLWPGVQMAVTGFVLLGASLFGFAKLRRPQPPIKTSLPPPLPNGNLTAPRSKGANTRS